MVNAIEGVSTHASLRRHVTRADNMVEPTLYAERGGFKPIGNGDHDASTYTSILLVKSLASQNDPRTEVAPRRHRIVDVAIPHDRVHIEDDAPDSNPANIYTDPAVPSYVRISNPPVLHNHQARTLGMPRERYEHQNERDEGKECKRDIRCRHDDTVGSEGVGEE